MINYGQLQALQQQSQGGVIAQLPAAAGGGEEGGDDFGSILSGILGLVSAFGGKGKGGGGGGKGGCGAGSGSCGTGGGLSGGSGLGSGSSGYAGSEGSSSGSSGSYNRGSTQNPNATPEYFNSQNPNTFSQGVNGDKLTKYASDYTGMNPPTKAQSRMEQLLGDGNYFGQTQKPNVGTGARANEQGTQQPTNQTQFGINQDRYNSLSPSSVNPQEKLLQQRFQPPSGMNPQNQGNPQSLSSKPFTRGAWTDMASQAKTIMGASTTSPANNFGLNKDKYNSLSPSGMNPQSQMLQQQFQPPQGGPQTQAPGQMAPLPPTLSSRSQIENDRSQLGNSHSPFANQEQIPPIGATPSIPGMPNTQLNSPMGGGSFDNSMMNKATDQFSMGSPTQALPKSIAPVPDVMGGFKPFEAQNPIGKGSFDNSMMNKAPDQFNMNSPTQALPNSISPMPDVLGSARPLESQNPIGKGSFNDYMMNKSNNVVGMNTPTNMPERFNDPSKPYGNLKYNRDVNMKGLNQDLLSKGDLVMQDLRDLGYDPVIASGFRTKEQQAEKVKLGHSRTMHSNHMTGNAMDIVDKRYQWDDKKYPKEIAQYARDIERITAKHGLGSGVPWKKYGVNGDFAHVQLGGGKSSKGKSILNNNQGPQSTYGNYQKASNPATLEIGQASAVTGVPIDTLNRIGYYESGFKSDNKNPNSSAGGTFQFIDSTWNTMVKGHGKKYGISQGDKMNPRANAIMGAEFIKENNTFLKSKIGREPTVDESYMAHFAGPGAALKIINAKDSAPLGSVFSKQAMKVNGGLMRGGTIGSFKRNVSEAMGKYDGKSYNTSQGIRDFAPSSIDRLMSGGNNPLDKNLAPEQPASIQDKLATSLNNPKNKNTAMMTRQQLPQYNTPFSNKDQTPSEQFDRMLFNLDGGSDYSANKGIDWELVKGLMKKRA